MDLTHGSCTPQSDSLLPPWLSLTLNLALDPSTESGKLSRHVVHANPPPPRTIQGGRRGEEGSLSPHSCKNTKYSHQHIAHSTVPSCPPSTNRLACTCTLAPSSLSLLRGGGHMS